MRKDSLGRLSRGISEDVWIPTLCFECVCGICLIRAHRVNGVVMNLEGNLKGEGFDELAQNHGTMCPKAFGLIQKLYNPHRIKSPMKRTNPVKGRGIDPKWVEISWEKALDAIAQKLKKVINNDPSKFVDVGPGRKPSINGTWECFLEALGPINNLRSGGGVHCRYPDHIFGVLWHRAFTCEADYSYCKYLLLLGYNPMVSGGATLTSQVADARAKGMKLVVVDPALSVTAAKADEWVPIKPCTDAAFLLALIHVIINEIGTYDVEFLKRMTNSPYLVGTDGYFIKDKKKDKPLIWDVIEQKAKVYDDQTIKDFALEGKYNVNDIEGKPAFQVLKDHVLQYNPKWASRMTDIPPDTIRRIAKDLVDNANIGSTIQIEGLELPYRPVSIILGRGVSGGSMRQYQAFLANHILTVLLGCLETVGGHKGGTTHPGGRYVAKGESQSPLEPSNDGMLRMESYPFTWPPVSSDAKETLFPYGIVTEARSAQLSYLNYSEPPKGFPSFPTPELGIAFRVNPLVSLGDPKLMEEVIKKVGFLVTIAYVENEVTELSDIVLPDNMDLERYDLAAQTRAKSEFAGIALRQPVVEPLWNTMDISDILTEIADRAGFLAEYNKAINEGLGMGLTDHYRLELGKKYSWTQILDRQCKSYTDGKYDLAWFKKNAALLNQVSTNKMYDVHLAMNDRNVRYHLPYVEHVKRTGEELRRNLADVGVDWWPTEEYTALPVYFHNSIEELPEEYNFYVTRCEAMQFYRATNVMHPWLLELAEHTRGIGKIVMNATTAESRGIMEGDEIWLESPTGRIKSKVKLVQGIHPDTLLIPGSFGHWVTPAIKEKEWPSLNQLIPIKYSLTDPLTGSMQAQVYKAKIYKA